MVVPPRPFKPTLGKAIVVVLIPVWLLGIALALLGAGIAYLVVRIASLRR